jgi:ubiquinone/menaquinone biosynthesis C-methylase UbiE
MIENISFDPIWEKIYQSGQQLNKYPYDQVVSFVFRYIPKDVAKNKIRILEIGCGAGNNVLFLAREGFLAYGIDASATAIQVAASRLKQENLHAVLEVADFVNLPFDDNTFDMIIDRGAVTCCGFNSAKTVFSECLRVLKTAGKFYFSPFSQTHTSFSLSKAGSDSMRTEIYGGALLRVGQICFYDKGMLIDLFEDNWNILEFQHIERSDLAKAQDNISAEWQIILEKKND